MRLTEHTRNRCAIALAMAMAIGACGKSKKGSPGDPGSQAPPADGAGGDAGGDTGGGDKPRPVTVIEAPVSEDTTWAGTSIYVVKGPLAVNATLTLDPCAIVKFDGAQAGLDVGANGKIVANGTAECPVVFTSIKDDSNGGDSNADGTATTPAKADWRSIALAADAAQGSTFTQAKIFYAGAKADGERAVGLDVKAGGTALDGCVFAHNAGGNLASLSGALDASQAPTTSVKDSVFFDNDMPVVIDAGMSFSATNHFQDPTPGATSPANEFNGVFVAGDLAGNPAVTVRGDVTWAGSEVPFVLPATPTITAGADLKLDSGVVVKLPAGASILVDGALTVNGTPGTDAPVVFTSIADDSRPSGIDTNNDGDSDAGAVRWTGNIYLNYRTSGHVVGTNHQCYYYTGEANPPTGACAITTQ